MKTPGKVQLITYADSLGGNLAALRDALDTHFPDAFGGLHILPPFPSSGDRGFAPTDYYQIEPAFGDWRDITALAQRYEVILDVMVNHISRRSAFFSDFLQRGEASPYAGFFLTPEKIWGTSSPPQADLDKIVLRRERPWSDYTLQDGRSVRMWTTFGATDPSEQIDLDVNNAGVRGYFADLFRFMGERGVSVLRLDAVGYVVKKPGTSCFFVEPEIYDFLAWAKNAAAACGLTLLNEVHAQSEVQNRLAAKGYLGYDFLLPYTVLHTLILRDSALFYDILQGRPQNQVTMLDCHDGVPVQPDMDGWLREEAASRVVETCRQRGARFTRLHTAERKNPGLPDVHQICGAFYSLLGCDDDAYMAARALQFFVPGTPQVYYVGLLAGENDTARQQAQQDDRELNRHNFTAQEIAAAVQKPVVKRLLRLIRLRNTHPAFAGTFQAVPAPKNQVRLRWQAGDASCELLLDLETHAARISDSQTGESWLA